MSTVPQQLNWVEKRATCRVAEVFDRLCLEIADDIIAINGIKQKEWYFKQDPLRDGSIVIGQPKRSPRVVVAIGVEGEQLRVLDQVSQSTWYARVGLNNEGRCVLKLEDGSELETWQFRKKALETLFFGD